MSNFTSASRVLETIRAGDSTEFARGSNRAKILEAANCMPPLGEDECKKLGIKINVNFGDLKVLLSRATAQLLSAFIQNIYYFTVKLPKAPAEHQSEWESFITQEINRPIRESLPYFELQRNRCKSTINYGVGPMIWPHDDKWLPRFTSLADIRIPTDTTLDFHNLNWFAHRVMYTPMELLDEVFNDKPNNKWDKKAVAKIIKNYKELNVTDATNNYDIETSPEKFVELIRQNGGFYSSDAVPAIPLYHFYFEDNTGPEKGWFMVVVPETGVVKGGNDQDEFLWKSDKPVAPSWERILHCQFGDLSEDTPAKFHAIRGLGILLLEPCFYSNLTMCRFLQHVHDNFNIWLKVQDNPEKARAQVQEFANLGVLKSGVSVVPEAERHQIETSNVEMALSQMKQRTSEASSSYTQESDSGTQKERTAFETRVEEEKVNAAMTTILMVAFKYESYAYREICRRFCLPNSDDPDIVTFRNRCKEAGIPPQWMDVKLWEIEPVTPLGMGNPTIAITMAEQLMAQRGAFNPTAQAEILHEFVLATTKDPRKAARWAPIAGKPQQSDATREAIGLFATLLIAAPGSVPPPQNNYVDQIEVLMPLLAGKIMLYTKRNNMADAEEAQGLMNVSGYIGQAIQALGQDPQQRQKVKQYGDSMGKLSNEIKALAQRGAEAAKKQAAQNGNGQAAEAQAKMQADKAQTAQSMAHKEQEFKASERRKDAEHRAEQRRKDAEAYAGTQRKEFESMASAHNNRLKSFKEPKGE